MLRRLAPILALAIALASLPHPASADPGDDRARGSADATLRAGESITIPLGPKYKLEISTTSTSAKGGGKGAALSAAFSSYAEQTARFWVWCGPLSRNGWCQNWYYVLHTDFNWQNGYLYYVGEYGKLVITGNGPMQGNKSEGHFTLYSNPANGWATVVRSFGSIVVYETMWTPIQFLILSSCDVTLNNDVNGWGGVNFHYVLLCR